MEKQSKRHCKPQEKDKEEIRKLLLVNSKPLDYGEIADELKLDLRIVVRACAELMREGAIEFV